MLSRLFHAAFLQVGLLLISRERANAASIDTILDGHARGGNGKRSTTTAHTPPLRKPNKRKLPLLYSSAVTSCDTFLYDLLCLLINL